MRLFFPNLPFLFLPFLLTACALFNTPPPLTETQLEELQTRQFEAKNALVFKSALVVLQGLGYSIQSSDKDTGLITAKSLTRQRKLADNCRYNTNPVTGILSSFCTPGERYQVFNRLSITLDQIGAYTHMRLSIIGVNSARGDRTVTDSQAYQAIFERIASRLFIRENLE